MSMHGIMGFLARGLSVYATYCSVAWDDSKCLHDSTGPPRGGSDYLRPDDTHNLWLNTRVYTHTHYYAHTHIHVECMLYTHTSELDI